MTDREPHRLRETPYRTGESMKSTIGTVAMAVGVTRIALGLGYMFAPGTLGRASFGPGVDSPQLRVTNKMLGSRELLVGAATLTAAQSNSPALGTVLLGAAAADAWDGYSALSTKGASVYAKSAIGAVALTASAIEAFVGACATRTHRAA
ncbi:hypothetical protein GCM10010198_00970 [Nocardia seriolae]|nr:hypothetical protein NSERKGN1266_24140 [Nocardia seriolae]BEK97527.1 hypothetical protein NSER024013_54330 [Nocardia seriolae]GEM27335.1 hypothetical protein NS2_55740 [Nocardia seriolae NBRC 15557]